MTSLRDGLKNSAVVSLLHARIKMAYKAKNAGFECPAWPVDSWVAKLKDLRGSPMPHLVKSRTGEPSKVAEVVVEAGDKAEAGVDAGDDGARKAGEDAVA
ncbi:hypothetical protein Hanom_Chr06g00521791 [Helianthus anomalus]